MNKKLVVLLCFSFVLCKWSYASDSIVPQKKVLEIPEAKWKFNPEGTRYLKFTLTAQVWLRYNQSNPGTIYENEQKPYTFDIGLRRLRMTLTAQPIERLLIYTQFGINSFNAVSTRKTGDFFHDAYVEYACVKRYLSVGAGLNDWTGSSRYASASITNALMYDSPINQDPTLDLNDQVTHKLSLFFKGKVNKLDYRLVLSDPFSVANSAGYSATISKYSQFTPKGKSLQYSGYFMYQFFDEESNLTPFNVGTYHGDKRVFNIGTGFELQPHATWNLQNLKDTVYHHMAFGSVDVFVDMPLTKRKDDCLSFYAVYNYYFFGAGYLRNLGTMNPAVNVDASLASLNGAGNLYPAIGNGHNIYTQMGYKLPYHLFGSNGFSIEPCFSMQAANWDRLQSWVTVFDAGLNFLIIANKAKISIDYQNRPVFDAASLSQSQRKSALIMALQIAI